MSYEHLREQLRPKHARVRAVQLIAAAVVGVGGVVSLVWPGGVSPRGSILYPEIDCFPSS